MGEDELQSSQSADSPPMWYASSDFSEDGDEEWGNVPKWETSDEIEI